MAAAGRAQRLRRLLVATFGGLALAAMATTAQAVTLSGTFNIQIYQGNGGGNGASPQVQANVANPLIIPADLLATGTYTGALEFNLGSGDTDTIGAFLATGGGVLSPSLLDPTLSGTTLTTAPFGVTTVFVITGSLPTTIVDGNITHDDGIGLYDGLSYASLLTPVGAEAPTVAVPTAYAGLTGQWKLVYVQANGLPAVLDFDVTRSRDAPPIPLPPALPLFVSALVGLGYVGWRGTRRSNKGAAGLSAT